jgi:hypothetical protein
MAADRWQRQTKLEGRKTKRLTIVTGLILVAALHVSCSPTTATPTHEKQSASPSAKSGARVTISKETTYITEPLRADGYPDYAAARNQLLRRGATPENNAAVLLWKAIGPKNIPKESRDEFFRMLAVPVLPETGDYRCFVRLLCMRSMLRLSDRKFDEA